MDSNQPPVREIEWMNWTSLKLKTKKIQLKQIEGFEGYCTRDAFYGVGSMPSNSWWRQNRTLPQKSSTWNLPVFTRTSTRTACTLWANSTFSRRILTLMPAAILDWFNPSSLASSVTLQVSQEIDVCFVPHLRPRWSADDLVPTRGRPTHL